MWIPIKDTIIICEISLPLIRMTGESNHTTWTSLCSSNKYLVEANFCASSCSSPRKSSVPLVHLSLPITSNRMWLGMSFPVIIVSCIKCGLTSGFLSVGAVQRPSLWLHRRRRKLPFVRATSTATSPPCRSYHVLKLPECPHAEKPVPRCCLRCCHRRQSRRFSVERGKWNYCSGWNKAVIFIANFQSRAWCFPQAWDKTAQHDSIRTLIEDNLFSFME